MKIIRLFLKTKNESLFYLDIQSEKKHLSLIDGLENFEKTKLKPTVTEEKVVLPDAETIENERKNKPESSI